MTLQGRHPDHADALARSRSGPIPDSGYADAAQDVCRSERRPACQADAMEHRRAAPDFPESLRGGGIRGEPRGLVGRARAYGCQRHHAADSGGSRPQPEQPRGPAVADLAVSIPRWPPAAASASCPMRASRRQRTVAQSLRPFPQFTSITSLYSPLGDTWYDSLQLKATKRTSYGLTFTAVFSWAKQLTQGADIAPTAATTGGEVVNDVFNRSHEQGPLSIRSAFPVQYRNQLLGTGRCISAPGWRRNWHRWLRRDWTCSTYLAYQSGLPILSPIANNGLQSLLLRNTGTVSNATFMNRVPGVPLYTVDLNCHCYDPNTTFVFNPAAWSAPAPASSALRPLITATTGICAGRSRICPRAGFSGFVKK